MKYGKYKALRKRACCSSCKRKCVVKPYRQLCGKCALDKKACSKCAHVVNYHEESAKVVNKKLENLRYNEMMNYVKGMKERTRRKIMDLIEKGLVKYKEGKFVESRSKKEVTGLAFTRNFRERMGMDSEDEDE